MKLILTSELSVSGMVAFLRASFNSISELERWETLSVKNHSIASDILLLPEPLSPYRRMDLPFKFKSKVSFAPLIPLIFMFLIFVAILDTEFR